MSTPDEISTFIRHEYHFLNPYRRDIPRRHDVYYINNPYQVTLHFDDEILISKVWVDDIQYDGANVTQVVFRIRTSSNTLTLVGDAAANDNKLWRDASVQLEAVA